MTRRSKLWRVAAGLFVVINLGGAVYAAALGEGLHAATHVVLLVVGLVGYLMWRLARAQRQALPSAELADPRIEYLQQSVDAIALEVERIGEKQRFTDKLRVEQGEKLPLKKDQ